MGDKSRNGWMADVFRVFSLFFSRPMYTKANFSPNCHNAEQKKIVQLFYLSGGFENCICIHGRTCEEKRVRKEKLQ